MKRDAPATDQDPRQSAGPDRPKSNAGDYLYFDRGALLVRLAALGDPSCQAVLRRIAGGSKSLRTLFRLGKSPLSRWATAWLVGANRSPGRQRLLTEAMRGPGGKGDLVVETKRFVKVFDFRAGHVTSVLKEGQARERVTNEVWVRKEFGAYLLVPEILGSSLETHPPFIQERLIHGEAVDIRCLFRDSDVRMGLVEVLHGLARAYAASGLTEEGVIEYAGRQHDLVRSGDVVDESVATTASALLDAIRTLVRTRPLPPVKLAQVHGDFAVPNLLMAAGQLCVLDWEMSRKASITHDVMNICAHGATIYDTTALWRGLIRDQDPVVSPALRRLIGASEPTDSAQLHAYVLIYCLEKLAYLSTVDGAPTEKAERLRRWLPTFDIVLGEVRWK